MEFSDVNDSESSDVSDDTRLAASARQLTITPLHDNLAPDSAQSDGSTQGDDAPASQVPIANLSLDSESTLNTDNDAKPISEYDGTSHFGLLIVTAIIAVALVAGIFVYIYMSIRK